MDNHKRLHHAGVRATLAELKERFWPIRCRQQVKRVLWKCVICQKLQSPPFDEIAAPLPLGRTRQATPFEIVGVDFAGSFLVKPFKKTASSNRRPKVRGAGKGIPVLIHLRGNPSSSS